MQKTAETMKETVESTAIAGDAGKGFGQLTQMQQIHRREKCRKICSCRVSCNINSVAVKENTVVAVELSVAEVL
jgi:hypothetical protein